MDYKENYLWENNHQNIHSRVNRFYEAWPDGNDFKSRWQSGVQGIKGILTDAATQNKKVKAIGGGWSLSKIVITNDYLIDTKPLKAIKINFNATQVDAGVDLNKLILCQCGTSVMEMNQALTSVHKSLPTTGASDGQTITGAISTGTHGAAINFGAMQDNVLGLHIITSGEEDIWLEGNKKVLSDSYVAELMPGAKRINDDAVFRAAIVSFGNFGFIHGVLSACQPSFLLSVFQNYYPWADVKNCLNGPDFQPLGLQPNPYHAGVLVNPYKNDNVLVTLMYYLDDNGAPTLTVPPQSKYGPSADVLTIFSDIGNTAPVTIPLFMEFLDKTIRDNYPVYTGQTHYPSFIFSSNVGSNLSGSGLSTELGIDASQTAKVADIIFDVTQSVSFLGMVSFRFVKKSVATLAFTKFNTSCAIEFPGVLSDQTLSFFNALFARLEKENIPFTFHWGQCNNLDVKSAVPGTTKVREKWGDDAVNSWIASRKTILPTAAQQDMFIFN